jgi:hypothetical protein
MAKIVFDSEKELEDYICKSLDDLYNPIIDEHVHWYGRQVEIGPYGVIDVMTVTFFDDRPSLDIRVIELKKETITLKSLAQACRYIKGVTNYFENEYPDYEITVSGVLVAPSIDMSDDTVYMYSEMDRIDCYRSYFDLHDGISYEYICKDWKKSNQDFSKFHSIYGIKLISEADRQVAEFSEWLANRNKSLAGSNEVQAEALPN